MIYGFIVIDKQILSTQLLGNGHNQLSEAACICVMTAFLNFRARSLPNICCYSLQLYQLSPFLYKALISLTDLRSLS